MDEEEVLTGGLSHAGLVVRVGDTVRRPAVVSTPAVQRLLAHLRAEGVPEAPEPLGLDDRGREVLSYVPGRAAGTDPADASDDLLAGLLDVQVRLHRAAAAFRPEPGDVWASGGYFPDGVDGPLVCHDDLTPANVIVDDGRVAGVVDWELARPVDRGFDIAVLARHWAPLRAPETRPAGWDPVDPVARFGAVCDGHRLAATDRAAVLDLAARFLDAALAEILRRAADGRPGYVAIVAAGYETANRADAAWLAATRPRLLRAV